MCASITCKGFGHKQGRSGITNPSRPGHGGGCCSATTRHSGGLNMNCKRVSHWSMVAVGAIIALVASAHRSVAADVAPGIDLWVTPGDGTSSFNFASQPIPGDFFHPGSDPFDGAVSFVGDPDGLGNAAIRPADTIVERSTIALVSACPSVDTVPIEIRALSLVSLGPITVTSGGGSAQLWDVRVCLSSGFAQVPGTITIRRDCDDGGTYDSVLPVTPKFIFTRQSDSAVRILDNGMVFTLLADGCWVETADPGFNVITAPPGLELDGDCDSVLDVPIAVGTTNFTPGLAPDPCADCGAASGQQVECPTVDETPEADPNDRHKHKVTTARTQGCCQQGSLMCQDIIGGIPLCEGPGEQIFPNARCDASTHSCVGPPPPPFCGDDEVNQLNEECDGAAAGAACPPRCCRDDCTCKPPTECPALPGWAGIALAGLLFVAGIFVFGSRRREPATC